MRVFALATASVLVLGLFGCGKITSLIKGEAPDAAPSAAPTPSAPEVAAVPADAAAAASATAPTATAHHTVAKDAGARDASADAAADAGADAAVAVVPKKPTRGEFSCDAAGCECESGAGCQITCPGVSVCKVIARELSNVTITGALGAVDVDCKKGSTCKLRGGVGASTVHCNGGTCTTDCGTGACNMICSGGKCAVNKKGTGVVKCTGGGCP